MASENTKPRILIVGGGLGGLTLAQCLRKQNIPFQIFERDLTPVSRLSGWAIALHTMLEDLLSSMPSDLPPLKESVHHLSPLNLESQICLYINGKRLVAESTPDAPIIRANRYRFRKWLSTQIPIQWGKRVAGVEEDEDEVRVHFEDGTTATGDILVGADGVNSIVREHVLQRPNSEILQTFPATMAVGEVTVSGKLFENQLALGHSCWVKSGPPSAGYFVFCGLREVSPDGKSGSYYWYVVNEDPDIGKEDHWLHSASQAEKLKHSIKITRLLEPRFTEIIRSTPVSGMRTHPLLVRDAIIHDLPVSRITLLGDAMHPMTPFRGEGGVHAIRDALNLGKVLGQLESNDTQEIKSLLGPYQEEMIERGIPAVQGSRIQGSNAHNTNTSAESKIISWGQVPKHAPEETISLEKCLPK
ncbi:putative monooxygenase [Hypoxylon rubiginosum]|uniref:Monooxygenase n=1 Tax=Hypoxylon rubiginosum TaxID=110542 RepID=A0ACC0CKA0_9PEZI|nr:putative monooxygenase [Hypoxylon rubiginosum]